MAFSSNQIKAIKAKREVYNTTTIHINGNLLKVIGIIAIVSPMIYFFLIALIYFVNIPK